MRDIGRRIHRYRLSRYAPPQDRVRQRLRWAWLLGALWLIWIGLISDHSLWRISRLNAADARTTREASVARSKADAIEQELRDARSARDIAENALRVNNGMARPDERIYLVRPGTPRPGAR